MSKKYLCSALLLTAIASVGSADVCKFLSGSVTCGEGTINGLSGNGAVIVHGTVIKGLTSVNGMLNAKNAEFNALHVNGSVEIDQCLVNDSSEIKGTLHASASKFLNSIEVYSNETKFFDSSVNGNLHINHSNHQKQIVYLSGNSEVSGDIIFDDGNGEVIVKGAAKISGKVVGGNLINK